MLIMYGWLGRMRFLPVVIVAAVAGFGVGVATLSTATSGQAASLTCAVNDRAGASYAARRLPGEGGVRTRVAAGTVVEIVTTAESGQGYPWMLVRMPGEPDGNYGWVDWRAITCN